VSGSLNWAVKDTLAKYLEGKLAALQPGPRVLADLEA
jgi:hypothetical protein